MSADKIRSLLPMAIEVIAQTLGDPQNPNRVKAAQEIIKQSGIFKAFNTPQDTNPMAIIVSRIPRTYPNELGPPSEADRIETMKCIYEEIKGMDGFSEKAMREDTDSKERG